LVGLLQAREDGFELRAPGTLEPVEVTELSREHDELLVDLRHLGILQDPERRIEGGRLAHGGRGRTIAHRNTRNAEASLSSSPPLVHGS
jgi:hypothetical protein